MPTDLTVNIILSILKGTQEYSSAELLGALKGKGVDEADIKEAVAYLINDHQVELTPDRRLRSFADEVHA